ncbi:MAG TPA: helix-turn-helix domain-containing protein [Marinilabiliaceae bacterium]|nr:helix-turn-helix domain-containing protein [Marinilabiliaceae bacterium]
MGNANIEWVQMTDVAIVAQIGQYIKQTRIKQHKTQAQLAEAAGLNRWTISQIENGESVTLTSLIQLLRALDTLHVLDKFIIQDELSPLAYAKLKKQQQKERVRNKSTKKEDKKDLGW